MGPLLPPSALPHPGRPKRRHSAGDKVVELIKNLRYFRIFIALWNVVIMVLMIMYVRLPLYLRCATLCLSSLRVTASHPGAGLAVLPPEYSPDSRAPFNSLALRQQPPIRRWRRRCSAAAVTAATL